MTDPIREADLVPRLEGQGYSAEALAERRRWLEERTGARLVHAGASTIPPEEMRGNIENPIGAAQVPLGVAGPLLVHGEHAQGIFYVPLATTEGALVRSYERGMVALTRAGGATVRVLTDENRVSPVFVFDGRRPRPPSSPARCRGCSRPCKAEAESTTRHGRLLRVEPLPAGPRGDGPLRYSTARRARHEHDRQGDRPRLPLAGRAAATRRRYYVFSGAESEKRASGVALRAAARARRWSAGARLPRADRARLPAHHAASGWPTSGTAPCSAISRRAPWATTATIANGLTALFIACGQDVANVANSAVGITTFEVVDGGRPLRERDPAVAHRRHGRRRHRPRHGARVPGDARLRRRRQGAEARRDRRRPGARRRASIGAAIASGEFVAAHETLRAQPAPAAEGDGD